MDIENLKKFDCASSIYVDMHYDQARVVEVTMWAKNHKYDSKHFVGRERFVCDVETAETIRKMCGDD